MASPTVVTLEVYQGDSFAHQFEAVDEAGDPFDLTGWTPTSQLRETPSSSSVTESFTVTVDAAASGLFTLSLTPTQTAGLSPGRLVYDVELDDGTDVVTVASGVVRVSAQVTR